MGGTDQTFNLLMGRHLQKEYQQPPQSIITMPILEGLDGVQKMSKSLNNHVGIQDKPNDMYGKIMSIPDTLIIRYFTLLLPTTEEQIMQLTKRLESENPKNLKSELACALVQRYHNAESAVAAKQEFESVFAKGNIPEDIPVILCSDNTARLDQLLAQNSKLSRKEIQRLIKQGAVFINDEKITDIFYEINIIDETVIKCGKRSFFKVKKQ